MAERGRVQIGGTVITESTDTLTLGSTLRASAAGALGWAIVAEIILFVAKLALSETYPPLGNPYIVWFSGLVVWLLAFLNSSIRPPLVVRRDGQVLELGKLTNKDVCHVVAREKGNLAVLIAQSSSSDEERFGRRAMFPTMEEAIGVAERLNAFLVDSRSSL